MKFIHALLLFPALLATLTPTARPNDDKAIPITIQVTDGVYRVEAGGELFAEYHFKDPAKPILYPILGPGQLPMTRNYPMKKGVPFESTDHPHHRSFWFTHGSVNGIDFWTEGEGKGKIIQKKMDRITAGEIGTIVTENDWIGPDGKVVCTDVRTLSFSATTDQRILDFKIIWKASEGPLVIGDTKEGTIALRTHPGLQLKPDPKVGFTTATGRAENSEGVKGGDIWGKRANWVHYQGMIEGKPVGLAIFDHPQNLRHPTWWMARDYGLVGANPFGIHDYESKKGNPGELKLAKGESLTQIYRFVFHAGERSAEQIETEYKRFTVPATNK